MPWESGREILANLINDHEGTYRASRGSAPIATSMPSIAPPSMPGSTNAGLPPELLAIIVTQVTPTDVYWHQEPEQRRQAKHQLVDLSLVCTHWSEVISPYLFRELVLRGAADLLFLRAIVDSVRWEKTPLGEVVEVLEVHQNVSEAQPWLVHLHWLSTRLQKAQLRCTVLHTPDASAGSSTVAPFRALPSLPPSYVRLTMLSLRGITFASLPELRRLVHTFPTLRRCRCEQLTIVDGSPIVRAQRTRRNASSALESFSVEPRSMRLQPSRSAYWEHRRIGRPAAMPGTPWSER